MKLAIIALFSAQLALASNSAHAHHSFAASFTQDSVTIEGTVESYLFKNPHVVFYINVEDKETGEVTRWMSEGPAATALRLAGWDKDTIKEGEYYRITGDAGRNGRPMVAAREILLLDRATGATLQSVSQERTIITPADPDSDDFKYPQTLANGLPNLNGVWVQGGDFNGPSFLLNKDPVFNEAGKALQDSIRVEDDPQYNNCEPATLVRQAGFTPHPVRITQYDDRVEFEYEEYAGTRVVYLDDREYHSFDENERTLMGRYKARYEDDALIIESDLLKAGWSGILGRITSDQARVVETYTRKFDKKWGPTVHLSMIVTDPMYLAEPRELFWDKYYTLSGITGTERDNVQLDYEMLPVECQAPLTIESTE